MYDNRENKSRKKRAGSGRRRAVYGVDRRRRVYPDHDPGSAGSHACDDAVLFCDPVGASFGSEALPPFGLHVFNAGTLRISHLRLRRRAGLSFKAHFRFFNGIRGGGISLRTGLRLKTARFLFLAFVFRLLGPFGGLWLRDAVFLLLQQLCSRRGGGLEAGVYQLLPFDRGTGFCSLRSGGHAGEAADPGAGKSVKRMEGERKPRRWFESRFGKFCLESNDEDGDKSKDSAAL